MATEDEGSVDWNAANEFYNGKAQAADEAADDAAPGNDQGGDGLVEVRIKGKTVKMNKEAADAYSAFVRETRERDGRLGGEIASLRERSARLEGMIETVRDAGKPASADADITPPPAKLAIENFEEWQRQMLAYQGAMMLRQQSELETKYATDQRQQQMQAQADAAQKSWADRFYASNPHLNKPHLRDIVTSVYRRNSGEIDALNRSDVTEAHDRLAELADAEIVAIKSDGKKIEGSTQRRQPPRLEGAGTPSGDRGNADTHRPTSAASWSQRKRAELRGEKRK